MSYRYELAPYIHQNIEFKAKITAVDVGRGVALLEDISVNGKKVDHAWVSNTFFKNAPLNTLLTFAGIVKPYYRQKAKEIDLTFTGVKVIQKTKY